MSNRFLAVASVLALAAGCVDEPLAASAEDGEFVDAYHLPPLAADDVARADRPRCTPVALRDDLAWFADNRETLDEWIASEGCTSRGYYRHPAPVALFDWDNTVVKNDVGDAITFHMIGRGKVLQPPGQDWHATSRYLTDAATTALTAACGTDVPAGSPLPTTTNLGCADEMLSIYVDGKTRAGAAAFAGHNYRRMEPAYAWAAQLLAGYRPAQIRQLTLDAVLPQLGAPQGTTQVVGTRTVNGWLRIYAQTQDVIDSLASHGYELWVITASPEEVVKALAPLTGIPAARVIGIRSLLDSRGRQTYNFAGCGPVRDGDNSMITYIEGKRCWVNKVVFGDHTRHAIERRTRGPRQVFAFGDSDTDIDFMRDATYKLALNRNKKELMCFAYGNEDGTWLVNPMFIEPRAAKTTPYTCSTDACIGPDGVGRPCRDDSGAIIPDQADTAHP